MSVARSQRYEISAILRKSTIAFCRTPIPLDRPELKPIAIDGKTQRGSARRTVGQSPLHVVSAWSVENHLTLGQVATHEKSNEITAIPELLKFLDLAGAVVTIDAMGCQKDIAAG